jgi:hypothetical protein
MANKLKQVAVEVRHNFRTTLNGVVKKLHPGVIEDPSPELVAMAKKDGGKNLRLIEPESEVVK